MSEAPSTLDVTVNSPTKGTVIMTLTIFTYRALQWLRDKESVEVSELPSAIAPTEEQLSVHEELKTRGWLRVPEDEPMLSGPRRNFLLNDAGKQRARRWADDYLVHSAAYEILQAIPTAQHEDLTSAEDAFSDDETDPVIGEAFTSETIEQATQILQEHDLITGIGTFGGTVLRIQLTPAGREYRREHWAPGLRAPQTPSAGGNMNQYNTLNISGGNVGAAQVGEHNRAQVQQRIGAQFDELREMILAQSSGEDQAELIEQVSQLEAAVNAGDRGRYEELKQKFVGNFAAKLGDRAAIALLSIAPFVNGTGLVG